MKNKKKYDFSGYVTKNDIKCTDNRTIKQDAFKQCDGAVVPLVWHHMHSDPENVLGNVLLENRPDGVYGYGSFNETSKALVAKALVEHGDISSMSIHATQVAQQGDDVIHGTIREVSLVIGGANRGAKIDNVAISHADGSSDIVDDELVISLGVELDHADAGDGETVEDIFNTLSEKQKNVVFYMIEQALSQSDEDEGFEHDDEGDGTMKQNVFDKKEDAQNQVTLTHADFDAIVDKAKQSGSLKQAVIEHAAATYGINNIEILFPDAKTVTPTPDFVKRDTDWVTKVINGVTHTPFSRIKSTTADITADEARAKGYVKGNKKVEEVIKVAKRITTPTTIYKKQKLDRDDIIDITDFNVVNWLWQEMRLMLNEEIARAMLVGDGRASDSKDKINEENIRPIWTDEDLYATHVAAESTATAEEVMEIIIRAMDDYEGAGSPVLYAPQNVITDWLLLKDKIGRRYYNTKAELASALGVSDIEPVPVMKGLSREVGETGSETTLNLIAIIVNLKDYKAGADKGGQIATFDDFDIDYNQYKYLMETRMSGCLVHPKSAIVIEQKEAAASE